MSQEIADIRTRRLRDDVGETYAEDTGILLDHIDMLEAALKLNQQAVAEQMRKSRFIVER